MPLPTVPPLQLPPALQSVLAWPIHIKGSITRHNPLGDPKIEKYYHKALEDGRWMEQNIADANHWLAQKKQYALDRIKHYTDMARIVMDGETISDHGRALLFAIDAIRFFQTINGFQQDIIGLIQALTQNIGLLSSMLQNILHTIQANLNALAILLNQICNWGLPDLPAIPNLFSDTIWFWNGFNFFPLAAFKPHIGFDTNFAFNQCHVHIPNINIFRNYPSSVSTYSGLPYGTPLFVPPLGGLIPNTGTNLSDPNFIATMQSTNTDPVYGPTFTPQSMLGSVPDPATIISNYQMPAQTYQDNIVSIVPDLRADITNVVYPSDPDYNAPETAVGSVRATNLRRDLIHYINLDNVVATHFDPYITSAWLFYLNASRGGRLGDWLQQYQEAYHTYIQPSVEVLTAIAVPWNNVLGGGGVIDTPNSIPFVDALKAMPAEQMKLTLWKLSYVEASMLGYTRSKTWDTNQDANYLSGVTGADLDYQATNIDATTVSTIVLGLGKAGYPVICHYPTALTTTLNTVIAQATLDIENDKTYQSPRLSNRFVYDQFAQAAQVDRYTQFWRDFYTNLKALLAQDSYLVQFTASYFGTLNGALNPLGDETAYKALRHDAATRNRTWVPGSPLLPIPKAPIVVYTSDSTPSDATSGWQGIQFDANAFLSRPDIQAQPIPVQTAMLRTNLSYAGLLQYKAAVTNSINDAIQNTQALISEASQFGFKVEAAQNQTTVPAGASVPVSFDLIDFDITSNVTNPTTFTLQGDGEYAYYGSISWEGTDTGQPRTVTVTQQAAGSSQVVAILTQSSDPLLLAPLTIQFSGIGNFRTGDVVQVLASHGFSNDQIVGAGSYFSMAQAGAQTPSIIVPSTSSTFSATAGTNMLALTAVTVQSDGTVLPLDPTAIVTSSPSGTILPPNIDGVTLAGVTTGSVVAIGTVYGAAYQIAGASLTVGGLLYVAADGTLTQDYNSLLTTVQWVICVGRAIVADTFIYEPHIPTRSVALP